jgi:hypothetical protein
MQTAKLFLPKHFTYHNCLIVRGNPDACSLTEAAQAKHNLSFTLITIKRGDSREKKKRINERWLPSTIKK